MRVFILLGLIMSMQAAGYEKADGYKGIWYFNEPTRDEYVYKYSGGLGTYCADHIPMAIYSPEADKTFFVYGGTTQDNKTLLEMVSYYDHKTGTVPRPTILMDKKTTDAHDNPVLSLDSEGHVWVFASSHGTSRPSFIFKSKRPYNVDDFDRVVESNFSYPQPWYIAEHGFLFMHTRYAPKRASFWMTSPDGIHWSEGQCLSYIAEGHYQVTWPFGGRVGSAFNYHPEKLGLNHRTNLYYTQTSDFGTTWTNVEGCALVTPLKDVKNEALVHDYEKEGLKVYINDINYDEQGRPIIFYVTSRTWKPGPEGETEWHVAHWNGSTWDLRPVVACDNNYDMGSLYVEPGGVWRIIGPAIQGPQAYNPGGEIGMWVSRDEGRNWKLARQITRNSAFNHTYVRRPLNADKGFYGFWADGHGRKPSESRLYFCDRAGHVRQLPYDMKEETAKPRKVN